MIKINLSPVRAESKTALSVSGCIVTLNGKPFDLSLLEDGATAEHEKLGKVKRTGEDYELTVALHHGKDAPDSTRFPVPLEVTGEYIHNYNFGGGK